MPAVDLARLIRPWPVIGGALAILFVLALHGSWSARHPGTPQGAGNQASRLRDLPARPEDIEAHGRQARSVLGPDAARAKNAAVPFAAGPLGLPRPFVFAGSAEDRARALECLATAVLYEAGDDAVGQAAVAQVVLNRVRHPAFPATVCGVVYQGAQRATGCQFTFTCDGAMARPVSASGWARARNVATMMLAGTVYAPVGLATHYHTDWVYPYWSPQLRKLGRVGTHLFFGWPGAWGGRNAFRQAYRGNEAPQPLAGAATGVDLQPFAEIGDGPPRILGLPLPKAELPPGMGKVPLYGNRLRLARADGRAFGLLTAPGVDAAKLVNAALALCARSGSCQVLAWSNEDDIPGEFPIPDGARSTLVFEYLRGEAGESSSVRFDCAQFPNRNPKACLSEAPLPAGLSGVRWKTTERPLDERPDKRDERK